MTISWIYLCYFLVLKLFLTFNIVHTDTSHSAPCLVAFSAKCSGVDTSVLFDWEPVPAEYFNCDHNVSGIVWYGVECTLANEWQRRWSDYRLSDAIYFVLNLESGGECTVIEETNWKVTAWHWSLHSRCCAYYTRISACTGRVDAWRCWYKCWHCWYHGCGCIEI